MKADLSALDDLLDEVKLNFDVLQTSGVGVSLRICYRNATLIVFVDNVGRGVGQDTKFKVELAKPQDLGGVADKGPVLSFTQQQGHRRLFLGVPPNKMQLLVSPWRDGWAEQ